MATAARKQTAIVQTATEPEIETVADLMHRRGDIPLERIIVRPPPGTATEKDVLKALEAPRKRLCELVDGVLVEKPRGATESLLALYVGRKLDAYAEEHDLGVVLGADGPLRLRRGLVRLPDISFISWDQIGGDQFPEHAIAGLYPDLAVEVFSKGNTKKEISRKLGEYFAAGTRLAWIIYPRTEKAEVYLSLTEFRILSKSQTLDGGDVLPGFTLPLKQLFGRLKRRRGGR